MAAAVDMYIVGYQSASDKFLVGTSCNIGIFKMCITIVYSYIVKMKTLPFSRS
jgi:hypothetical protein